MFLKSHLSKITFIVALILGVIAAPCFAAGSNSLKAKEFTWGNVSWLALKMAVNGGEIKLSKLPHGLVIAAFMPQTYQNKSGSQFAMRAAYPKALKIGVKKVQSLTAKNLFIIRAAFEFGKYNFNKHVFPLRPFKNSTYYHVSVLDASSDSWISVSGYPNARNPWPAVYYNVFFDDPGVVDGLPMSESKAAKFINKRTNGSYVDRKVYAKVYFSIDKFSDQTTRTEGGDYAEQGLMAHIREVDVYSDSEGPNLLKAYKP